MKTTVLSIVLAMLFIAPSLVSCGGGKAVYGVRKQSGFRKCNSRAVRKIRNSDIQGVPALWPSILTMPDLMPAQTSIDLLPNSNS